MAIRTLSPVQDSKPVMEDTGAKRHEPGQKAARPGMQSQSMKTCRAMGNVSAMQSTPEAKLR